MDRFFRRLGIIAALALGILGITATALALAFPLMDHAWWQLILWGCGISLAGLVLWFLWELNILSRNWRRNWEFRWPITKKQNISPDNNLTRRNTQLQVREQSQNTGLALTEARDLRGERYRPRAPDGLVELIDARPDPRPAGPTIIYKRKLRVALRNRASKEIEVRAAPRRIFG